MTHTPPPARHGGAAPVSGLVMGTLAGLTADGDALVDFDGNPAPGPAVARSLAPLAPEHIGSLVALQFERGDIARAVVMGLLHRSASAAAGAQPPLRISAAGDEVRLVASGKLTLQCGRASITLEADGNVEIRGQDLLARAAGRNEIKGSSVSIN